VKVVLGGSSLRVSGASQGLNDNWKMTTVAYNLSTGAQIATHQTGGDAEGIDRVNDVVAHGNDIYVVGAVENIGSAYDWKIIKLNDALNVVWSATHNGTANLDDTANAICVDGSGNVYVTGFTSEVNEAKNMTTQKYSSSGVLQWTSSFHNEADDEGQAIEIDNDDNIIVSGSSFKVSSLDFQTIAYKPQNGGELWSVGFNSIYNRDDVPSDIAISDDGDVYVVGSIEKNETTLTYFICHYSIHDLGIPQLANGFSSAQKYIENRGQLRSDSAEAVAKVKFYNTARNVDTFIEDKYINYQVSSSIDTSDVDTLHRVKMHFSKGLANPKVFAVDTQNGYHNYYLEHMNKPSERTPLSDVIVRPHVYQGVDAMFTHTPSGFEHCLVIDQGSATNNLEMTFDGQTSLALNANGDLVIGTSLDDIILHAPKAHYMNPNTGALTALGWNPQYNINGSTVEFTGIGAWSGKLVLTFGQAQMSQNTLSVQNVDWSTFIAGDGEDYFEDVVSDSFNSCYAIGETNMGTFLGDDFQIANDFSGNNDVLISKFNAQCEAQYLTFYGGDGNDYGNAIGVDQTDEEDGIRIYAVGLTLSNNLDAINVDMQDNTYGGAGDGFYARFNNSGFLNFHTYVGGSGFDELNALINEPNPNNPDATYLCYAGSTTSGTGWNLNTQNFAYNQAYSGGRDGIVILRNLGNDNSDTELWGTFFGSDGDDAIDDVALADGSVVLIGRTNKEDYSINTCMEPSDGGFPKCHQNATFQQNFLSNNNFNSYNYFLAYLDGGLKWSTYLCGAGGFTSKDNRGALVLEDASNNNAWKLHVHGTVLTPPSFFGPLEFPLDTLGWHQSMPGTDVGGQDAFLCSFTYVGGEATQTRGTLYGGSGNEQGGGISFDRGTQTLFITGQSKVNSIQNNVNWCSPPTNGDFPMCDLNGMNYTETNFDGANNRSYVAGFLPDGSMRWSTQYGDGNNNQSSGIFANNGKVWIVGGSGEDWTEIDYDINSLSDYAFFYGDDSPTNREATIARFDIQTIVGTNNVNVQEQELDLQIYPNPNQGSFQIQSNTFKEGEQIQVRLYSLRGDVVAAQNLNFTKGLLLNYQQLAKGMYVLQLVGERNSVAARVQVQ